MSELTLDEKRKAFQEVKKLYRESHDPVCAKCGRYIPWGKDGIDVHHIRALFDGGNNENDNLVPLCKQCHHDLHFWSGLEELPIDEWESVPPGTLMELCLMKYGKEYLIYMIDHWQEIKGIHTECNRLDIRIEERRKAEQKKKKRRSA